MKSIYIKMKDGSTRNFEHEGRAGGSYSKEIRYEMGFVVVTDEWGNETAIPTENIHEVRVENVRRGW